MFDVFITCDLYEPFHYPTEHHSVVTSCHSEHHSVVTSHHLPFNFKLVSIATCTKYLQTTFVIVMQLCLVFIQVL